MAKKRTDDFDLDADLNIQDFDFGDIDGQFSKEAKDKKSRNPVTDVFKGSISGAKSTFTDPAFLAKATRDSLPESYGTLFDTADKTAASLASLYDNAVKEIKPQAQNLARKLDKLVPEESKTLKKITSKFKEKVGAYDESKLPSQEQIRTEALKGSLGEIFDQQNQRDDAIKADDNARDAVRDAVDKKRFESSQDYLKQITDGVTTLSDYTTKIGQAASRKSLELQFRTYFVLADMLEASKKWYEVARVQNEAIAKNTALPEFVKVKNSERFRDLAKNRFIDKIQGGLFNNNFVDKAMERLKAQVQQLTEGVKTGLSFANEGVEAVEAIKEANKIAEEAGIEPVSKANFAGQIAGGAIAGGIQSWGSKKIRAAIPEKSRVGRFGESSRELLGNVQGYADDRLKQDDMQNQEFNPDVTVRQRLKKWGLELLKSEQPGMRLSEGLDLRKLGEPGAQGDKRVELSQTVVIPGYLARIYREITMLRTNSDDAPLTSYDYASGKFLPSKQLASDLKDKLIRSIKDSGHDYRIQKASRDFTEGADDGLSTEIRGFFHDLSQKSMRYTPENIQNSDIFKKLSPEAQKRIQDQLDKKITNADLKEKGQADFTESIKNIRDRTPDVRDQIEAFTQAGYGELLEKEGVLKRNASGGFDIDRQAYDKLVKDNTIATSDINMKEGISKLDTKGMLAKIRKTKLYNWGYKQIKGKGGPKDTTDYAGPMAQDVQQNMGEEFGPKGKEINLINMNAANMSAIQELDKRQRKLDGQGDNVLTKIQKDVSEIVRLLTRNEARMKRGGKGQRYATGNEVRQPQTYGDHFGQLFDNILGIGRQAVGDTVDAAKKVKDFGINKIIKPAAKGAEKAYDKYKDPIKEFAKKSWDKAVITSSKMLNFGQDLLFNQLPTFAKKLGKKAIEWKDKLFKALEGPVDVFKKGLQSPVLQANLMRMGYYLDQATGDPIKAFSDIKGPVVNRLGEVVLSAEDIAQGLYDNQGKPLLAKGAKLLGALKDAAIAGGQRLFAAGKKIVDFIGKSKPGEWIKKKFSGIGSLELPSFEIMGRSHDVLVEIRDILRQTLLGEDMVLSMAGGPRIPLMSAMNKIPHRTLGEVGQGLAEGAKARYKEGKGFVGNLLQQGRTKLGGMLGGQKSASSGSSEGEGGEGYAEQAEDFVGPHRPGQQGIRGKAKDLYGRAKEKIRGGLDSVRTQRDFDENLHGPMQPSKRGFFGRLKDRAGESRDSIKTRFGAAKEAWANRNSPENQKKALRAKRRAAVAAGRGFGKIKGVGAGFLSKVAGVAGMFAGGGSSDEEQQHEEDDETNPKRESHHEEASKKETDPSKATFNDRDGSGRRDGAWQDRLDAQEAARKERQRKIDDNKPDAAKARYKGENVLDTLAKRAKGLFDTLTSGASSILGMAGDVFSMVGGGGGILSKLAGGLKGAGKGIVNLGGKALGAIGLGSRAAGAASAVGGVSRLASAGAGLARIAGAARTGLMIAGLASGGALGTIAGAAGIALSAIGTVLASPVVLTGLAVAAVGYGLYKGYKYATRNDVDEFQAIRVQQYGLTNRDDDVNYNSKIIELESYLVEEGVVGFAGNQAQLLPRKLDSKRVLAIFGIDEKNDEQVNNFMKWFQLRFKPFFLGHCTALFMVNNKTKLTQLNSLKPDEKLRYLEMAGQESGPYDELTSPFPGKEYLTYTKTVVQEAVQALVKKYTELRKKDAEGKNKTQAKPPVNVLNPVKKPDAEGMKKIDEKSSANKRADTAAEIAASQAKKSDYNPPDLGEEGSQKDRTITEDKSTPGGGKLKIAGGAIRDGESGMQYIDIAKGETLEGLTPYTRKNFLAMAQEYGELTGKKIPVNAGARTYQMQAALHAKDPKKAAKPGFSMHEFGFAVDTNTPIANELESLGLMRKYGFTRPVGGETWHMEPAGIQTALSIAKSDPASADDLVKISLGHGGGGMGTIPGSRLAKRDGAYAKSLWDQGDQTVDQKKDEKAPEGLAKITTESKDEQGKEYKPKTAANDSKIIDEKQGEQGSEVKSTKIGQAQPVTIGGGDGSPGMNKPTIFGPDGKDMFPGGKAVEPVTQYGMNRPTIFGPDGTDLFAKNDGETKPADNAKAKIEPPKDKGDVKKQITDASKKVGVDPNSMVALAAVESGLDPNAKSPNTSASGVMQIINSTWNEGLKKYGNKYDLSSNDTPFDVTAATYIAGEDVKKTRNSMKAIKPDLNTADDYLGHFFGAGGARRFLKALKDTPEASAANVFPDAAAKNGNLFYKNKKPITVAEFYQNIQTLVASKAKRFGVDVGTPTLASFSGQKASEDSAKQANTAMASASPSGGTAAKMTQASYSPPPGVKSNGLGDASAAIEPVTEPKLKSNLFSAPQSSLLLNPSSPRREKGESSMVSESLAKQLDIQGEQLTTQKVIVSELRSIKELLAQRFSSKPDAAAPAQPQMQQASASARPSPKEITPAVSMRRTA